MCAAGLDYCRNRQNICSVTYSGVDLIPLWGIGYFGNLSEVYRLNSYALGGVPLKGALLPGAVARGEPPGRRANPVRKIFARRAARAADGGGAAAGQEVR